MSKRIQLNLELYKKVYLIRKSEQEIIKYYPEDEMKTPMHMSMGEEAIAAGICHALKEDDQVFGTYRSHALYLAKTLDTYNFFAEMYGKATSLLKGKGGSMHLCAPNEGFMGTSAIVSSIIPVAVGAAFSNKTRKTGKVVAVFFGDGALDEGVFWESLNAASLLKLPVIFVCENNGFAVHTAAVSRQGYKSISEIVNRFKCRVYENVTTDAEVIYKLALKAVGAARKDSMPVFLHFRYYRYLEHVGINEDFDAGYRSRKEFEKWLKVDPVKLLRKKLLKLGCNEGEIKKIESSIDTEIEKNIQSAKAAPFSEKSELYKEVLG
ncbi:MAG: thiamine pyrophosphate-dependent dehydrogenase E1 component subunit alpha [Elusimicrobiota bacterium]